MRWRLCEVMLFKSCCMVSIQFFRLPGFLFVPLVFQSSVQCIAWQSVVVHLQKVPEPRQYCLFYDEIYLLQLSLRPGPLVTDFVFP